MPEAIPRQLKDYERPDGIKPFQEWIYQVKEKDPSTAVKIYGYVDRIQLGNMSNAKLLPGCEGVWEFNGFWTGLAGLFCPSGCRYHFIAVRWPKKRPTKRHSNRCGILAGI